MGRLEGRFRLRGCRAVCRAWLASVLVVALGAIPCLGQSSVTGSTPGPTTAEELDALLKQVKAMERNEPRRALELSKQAVESARELGLRSHEMRALNRQGIAHLFLAEYSEAFGLINESARLAEMLGDDRGKADATNNLGVLYYLWGAWAKALEHYQLALELKTELNDLEGIAQAYNNLGGVSQAAKQWEQALDYYRQSLPIYQQLDNAVQEANSHNNIGLVYLSLGELETAGGHFRQALEIAESIGDRTGTALAETHLGLLYQEEGQYEQARRAHERSLQIRREIGDRQGQAVCLHNLGALAADRGLLGEAVQLLEAARDLAQELDIGQLVRDTYLKLSETRRLAGDLEGALEDYKRYKEVEDRLFDQISRQKLAEARAVLELDQKDRQIEQLQARRAQQRFLRFVLVVVSVLLFVIVLSLLSRYRLKVRVNREIQRKNRQLEGAQAELERATRAEVAHLSRVASLGELTASVAHELNQPLAAILTNAQVAETLLDQQDVRDEELQGAVQDIVLASRRTWELLRHLRKLAKPGELEPELLDLRTVLREVEPLLATEARRHEVAFEVDLPLEDLSVAADAVHMQQVVLNLTQNAIRAAASQAASSREKAWVGIEARRENGSVVVAVSDSGPGAVPEVLDRMFEPFFTTSEDGMGMGLAICRRLVQAHGGQIWARPRAEGGLTVSFCLPPSHGS